MLKPAAHLLRWRVCGPSIGSAPSVILSSRPVAPRIPTSFLPTPFRRSIHIPPDLPHQHEFTEKGIPPLFTADGFKVGWIEYQQMLVDRLNELVAGTELQNNTAQAIAVNASRRPELASVFNHASQAHNNHFFFEALSANPQDISEDLLHQILPTFGSVQTLKAEMLTTALSLFGSGSVWLVLDALKKPRILATYNAGTPHGSGNRRQDIDTNTMSSPTHNSQHGLSVNEATRIARNAASAGVGGPGSGSFPIPILCVSMWPQVYLTDYGVSTEGRSQYLENWWQAIDWSQVHNRWAIHLKSKSIGRHFALN